MNQRTPGSGSSRPDTAVREDKGAHEASEKSGTGEASQAGQAAQDRGRQAADTAREQGQEVAQRTKEESREVAETARGEAQRVADEAKTQARNIAGDATDRLHEEARRQTGRAAQRLHDVGNQMEALADGRPEEAGPVPDYARRAAEEVDRFADRLEAKGFDGITRDVEDFARQRPGMFLAGAAAAGLLVGRLARNRNGEGR